MPRRPKLILASQSQSRQQLLKLLEVPFSVHESKIIESDIITKNPQERVQTLALKKAQDVASREEQGIILAADTIIVHNQKILEKPKFKMEAVEMLKILSNSVHTMLTGWVVLNGKTGTYKQGMSETYIHFRTLSHQEIIDYCNQYNVVQWAGGYNSQLSNALHFIKKVDGSLSGMNGLPFEQIVPVLRRFGVPIR